MHIFLEGDRLAGKTTIAQLLRRSSDNITVVENRGLASALPANLDLTNHFQALRCFATAALTNCVICRGPVTAFSIGSLSSVAELSRVVNLFDPAEFAFAWLDLSFDTYIERIGRYLQTRGIQAGTEEHFNFRRERYIGAYEYLGGRLERIQVVDEAYQEASFRIAHSIGWTTARGKT